jgi:hypothetical protein
MAGNKNLISSSPPLTVPLVFLDVDNRCPNMVILFTHAKRRGDLIKPTTNYTFKEKKTIKNLICYNGLNVSHGRS